MKRAFWAQHLDYILNKSNAQPYVCRYCLCYYCKTPTLLSCRTCWRTHMTEEEMRAGFDKDCTNLVSKYYTSECSAYSPDASRIDIMLRIWGDSISRADISHLFKNPKNP